MKSVACIISWIYTVFEWILKNYYQNLRIIYLCMLIVAVQQVNLFMGLLYYS